MQIKDVIGTNKIIGIIGNSGSGKSELINKVKMSKNIGIVNQDIIKHCNDTQINTLSSFYMYSIGLDNFVRVLDNDNQFLRISLSIYVDENKTLYLINKIIDYLNNL